MEEAENKYFNSAPLMDRVKFFTWLKKVPSYLQRYLSYRYIYGKSMSYLVSRESNSQPSFYKYEEILKITEKLEASRE